MNLTTEEKEQHLQELPVVRFNWGGDRIECHEITHLHLFSGYVKRDNTFMCVKTGTLMFLDIKNYLAPGFSYRLMTALITVSL